MLSPSSSSESKCPLHVHIWSIVLINSPFSKSLVYDTGAYLSSQSTSLTSTRMPGLLCSRRLIALLVDMIIAAAAEHTPYASSGAHTLSSFMKSSGLSVRTLSLAHISSCLTKSCSQRYRVRISGLTCVTGLHTD